MNARTKLGSALGVTTLAVMAAALAGLVACSAPAPWQPTRPATPNLARPYVEGMAALEQYRASSERENERSREVEAKIALLEADAAKFGELDGSLAFVGRETRERHSALAFAFADEALRKGALDNADRTYRRLVEFYVGAAYSGIRERARIGIDDVRARRVAAPVR